ncbi:MAG: hypothetical protein EXS03_04115 [Phycisphaerales bacterium]|nr:hypothetical protein [Phycisphaerales bacterium]
MKSALAVLALLGALSQACDEGRTVYVKRGAGMLGLEGNVGDEYTLPDGTRVVIVDEVPSRAVTPGDGAAVKFVEPESPPPAWTGGPMSLSAVHVAYPGAPKDPPPKDFEPRKELGHGKVRFSAMMPEHVLSNLIDCLRKREYQPFYEQMLSDEARVAYERAGGAEVFATWAEEHRESLLAFLNRLGNAWAGSEVIPQTLTPKTLRFSLDKREIQGIRFTSVDISMEHGGCRLAMVK